MFTAFIYVHAWFQRVARSDRGPGGILGSERGQTTAEYALVIVGVAAIALLVLAWATSSGAIGKLFDFILGHIMGQVH